jgi:hypothetical protein
MREAANRWYPVASRRGLRRVHDTIVGARNPCPPGAVDQQLVELPQYTRLRRRPALT